MESQTLTVALAGLIVLGIAVQWLSAIARIPSILLLLVAGVIAGPATNLIDPQKVLGDLLTPFTSLAIAIILFEGGLSLRFKDIKEVGHLIRNLVTIGAAAGAGAIFFMLYYVLEFSLPFSLIESVVLTITGPTVVTPLLSELHVKQPVRSILKWEGIIIDPIGAISAVLVFEAFLYSPKHPFFEILGIGALLATIVGVAIGGCGALFLLYTLRKFWIPDSQHSPVTLMVLILAFTASNAIHVDSGLLTVTIMGIILSNQDRVKIAHIIDFKENLTVILISFLFITLAGIIDPKQLISSAWLSLGLVLFVIFVARPLTVLVSGAFWKIPQNQALFMCCLAPRGIVTAVMASLFGLELSALGYADAEYFAPLTFAVIIGTVTFYSLVTPIAARFLNVSLKSEAGILIIGANPLARAIGGALKQAGLEVQLIDPNYWKVAETKKSALPVYRGTFLAFEHEFPDRLNEMNIMLAMTENDDVNSLAVIHLRNHFDESELFQLPANTKKIKEALMGRQLFSDSFDYHTLSALLQQGGCIKTTRLSPEFTFSDWQKEYSSQNAVLLFHILPNGMLLPQTTSMNLSPGAKGKIVFLCEQEPAVW